MPVSHASIENLLIRTKLCRMAVAAVKANTDAFLHQKEGIAFI